MQFITIILLSAILVVSANADTLGLPSYIKPCKLSDPNFGECATKSGREAIKQLIKGDPERGIPVLEPLFIKKVNSFSGSSLNIVMKNINVEGLSKMNLVKVDIDAQNKKIKGTMKGNASVKGKYEMDGRLLIIPITGKGDMSAVFKGCTLTYETSYSLKKVDGVEFIKLKNTKLVLDDLKGATFKMDNLFGGNSALSDTTNQIINENWKIVSDELNPGMMTEVKKVIDSSLQKIFDQAPANEVFLP